MFSFYSANKDKQSLFSAALLYSPMTGLKRRSTHSPNEHNEGLHSGNFWHIHITIEHHYFYTIQWYIIKLNEPCRP